MKCIFGLLCGNFKRYEEDIVGQRHVYSYFFVTICMRMHLAHVCRHMSRYRFFLLHLSLEPQCNLALPKDIRRKLPNTIFLLLLLLSPAPCRSPIPSRQEARPIRRRELRMEAYYWLETTLPFLGVTWQAAQLLGRANQPCYPTLTRNSADEL